MKILNSKQTSLVIILFIFIFSLNLIGCTKEQQGHILTTEEKAQIGNFDQSDDLEDFDNEEIMSIQSVPVWDSEDLLITRVVNEYGEDAQVAQYETSVVMEPKYYTDSMPLSYTVAYAPEKASGSFGVVSMSGLPMIYKFDNFINLFISDESDLYVIGASTIEGKKVVAEAKLLPNDGSDQLQIEEFHYNSDEDLIFYCKNQFDSLGFKVSETEIKGTKIKDYYFIWPTP